MGDVGRSLSSRTTFWDENDGPNVDSNASAEGSCDAMELELLRGESGNLLCDRGLFVNDEAGINPETCDDEADLSPPPPVLLATDDESCCHSFDLAVLIPRRDLDPNGVSLSLGDRFNVLIRLQSFENTSRMVCRMPLSIASTSHSANESLFIESKSFFPPPMRLCTCEPGVEFKPTSNPSVGEGELSLRSCDAAVRKLSARLVSLSIFLPRSNHPGENTSVVLSSIISTAAMMGSMSL